MDDKGYKMMRQDRDIKHIMGVVSSHEDGKKMQNPGSVRCEKLPQVVASSLP